MRFLAEDCSYFPRTPNELVKVDVVLIYTFQTDNKNHIKEKQIFNINTTYLDKYHIGKAVPVVYYRGNPNYSKIDVYDKSLQK